MNDIPFDISVDTSRCCVVDVATGPDMYLRCQRRLQRTFAEVGWPPAQTLCWTSAYPPGSPPHEEMPYAFKLYAIREAERQGFRSILWADSSVWAAKPIEPLFAAAARHGYILMPDGCANFGIHVCDAVAKMLGVDQDGPNTNLAVGKTYSLDLDHPTGKEIYQRMWNLLERGVYRDTGSRHPRYGGHRHDEVAISYIMQTMKLPWSRGIINSPYPDLNYLQSTDPD